jgi:hypothetical protein
VGECPGRSFALTRMLVALFLMTSPLFLQTDSRENIFSLLRNPVPIGNVATQVKSSLKAGIDMPEYTISGWIYINKIHSNVSNLKILKVIDQPNPLRTKILEEHTSLSLELKNDFSGNRIDLVLEFPQHRLKHKSTYESFRDIIELGSVEKTWLFFAISMDYPEGTGSTLVKLFRGDGRIQYFNKQFDLYIPTFELSSRFEIEISANKESSSVWEAGQFLQLNICPFYIVELELISLLSIEQELIASKNKVADFVFSSRKVDGSFFSFGKIKKKVEPIGSFEQRISGLCFANSSGVNLNSIASHVYHGVVTSPTFYFHFKPLGSAKDKLDVFKGVYSTKSLINGEESQRRISISLLKNILDQSYLNLYVEYSLKDRLFSVLLDNACTVLQSCRIFVSFVTYPNSISKILVFRSKDFYKVSEIFNIAFDLSDLEYTILEPPGGSDYSKEAPPAINSDGASENIANSRKGLIPETSMNKTPAKSLLSLIVPAPQPHVIINQSDALLIITRLTFLQSPAPLLALLAKKQFKSNCRIPLMPRLDSFSCLSCENSVLYPEDNKCLEFCPVGFRSLDGLCVPCRVQACLDADPTHSQITRTSNSNFLLSFNRNISNINETNIASIFIPVIANYTGEYPIDFNVTVLNDTSVDFEIIGNHTIYRFDLVLKFNHSSFEALYDDSRTLVNNIDSSYHIKAYRYLTSSSQTIEKIMIFIVILAFFCTCFIMIAHVMTGWKEQIDHCLTRRLARSLHIGQVVSFLIFLNVLMPASLQNYIWLCYKWIIGNFSISSFDAASYYDTLLVPNFPNDKSLSSFSLNFGILLFLHWIAVIVYLGTLIYGWTSVWAPLRFKTMMDTIKENFKFDHLVFFVIVFDIQAVFFSTSELRNAYTSVHYSFYTYASIAAITYALIYIIVIVSSVVIVISRKISESKIPKAQKLNVGYSSPTVFEIFHVKEADIIGSIGRAILSVNVVLFKDRTNLQLTILIVAFAASSIFIMLLAKNEQNAELTADTVMYGSVMLSLVLFVCLQFQSHKENYGSGNREIIGWCIVSLLFFVGMLNFAFDIKLIIKDYILSRNAKKLMLRDSGIVQRTSKIVTEGQIVMGVTRNKTENELEDSEFAEKKVFGNLGNIGKVLTFKPRTVQQTFDADFVPLRKIEICKSESSLRESAGLFITDVENVQSKERITFGPETAETTAVNSEKKVE